MIAPSGRGRGRGVLVFMKGAVLVTLNATSGSVGQSELDPLVTIARTMAERL